MTRLFSSLKHFLKMPMRIANMIKVAQWVLRQAPHWNHIVIHRNAVDKLPKRLAVAMICGHVKGKLRCPSQLTIILIHDYHSPPLMEMSLQYVGINNYVVVKPPTAGPWRGSKKILAMNDYLRSGRCHSEYLLYCDSTDAVLRDDPAKAITYLQEQKCDLLISNTPFTADFEYQCMPQALAWADQRAREHGCMGLYINAGVFIGRTDFLREVFDAAEPFVTDHDLSRDEEREYSRKGELADQLPEFPKGIGSDQIIMRHLHPQFYPRMKIDYKGQLALR